MCEHVAAMCLLRSRRERTSGYREQLATYFLVYVTGPTYVYCDRTYRESAQFAGAAAFHVLCNYFYLSALFYLGAPGWP